MLAMGWRLGGASQLLYMLIALISIGNVIFSHISREANKVAHKLARLGFLDKKFVTGIMSPLTLFLVA
jgi:hypothetical protein